MLFIYVYATCVYLASHDQGEWWCAWDSEGGLWASHEGAFVRDFSRTRLGGFAHARVGRTCGIRGSDMWHVTFGMAMVVGR